MVVNQIQKPTSLREDNKSSSFSKFHQSLVHSHPRMPQQPREDGRDDMSIEREAGEKADQHRKNRTAAKRAKGQKDDQVGSKRQKTARPRADLTYAASLLNAESTSHIRRPRRLRRPELVARRKRSQFKAVALQASLGRFRIASDSEKPYNGCFFSCVVHQLNLADNSPSTNWSEKELQQKCKDWLGAHQDDIEYRPFQAASASSSTTASLSGPKRPIKSTSTCFAKRLNDLLQNQPRIINAYIQACCNVIEARIAILCQKKKESQLSWEIWEPHPNSDSAPARTVYLGRVGNGIYESLVPLGDSETPVAYTSDEDSGADDDEEDQAAFPTVTDCQERTCAACGKKRWVFVYGDPPSRQGDNDGSAAPGDEFVWACSQGMGVETAHSDPMIWHQIMSFWSGHLRTTEKFLYQQRVDLSFLFVYVQAFNNSTDVHTSNGLKRLKDARKVFELARRVAPGPGLKSATSQKLQTIYRQVFKTARPESEGGGMLETLLLMMPEVTDKVNKCREAVFTALSYERGSEDVPLEEALSLQAPYQPRVSDSTLDSDDIEHHLRKFQSDSEPWVALRHRSAPWFEAVEAIMQQVADFLEGNDKDDSLIFLGDSNVGKSRILDLLLWMSAKHQNDYPGSCREAEKLLGILRDAAVQAGFAVPGNDASWAWTCFTVDAAALEEHVSGSILKKEQENFEAMCRVCEGGMRQHVLPFALPTGLPTGSTTACPLSVRLGRHWQVVLEYRTDILEQWLKWDNLSKVERRSRQQKESMKRIRREVSIALGEDDAYSAKVDAFLSQCRTAATDVELPFELGLVIGQCFALCGAGASATKDRIFARRVLYYAQGLADVHHELQVEGFDQKMQKQQAGPPFLFFGNNDKCLSFGKRTFFALKRITLICPCIIAPQCGSGQKGLMDACGCNDSDPIKKASFCASADSADAAVVIVDKHLQSRETIEGLFRTKAIRTLVDDVKRSSMAQPQTGSTKTTPTRLLIAANVETQWSKENNQALEKADMLGKRLDSQKQGSKRESDKKLKERLVEFIEGNSTSVHPVELADSVKERIPMAWPCFFLFSSQVLSSDYKHRDTKEVERALEAADCYQVLGFIEQYLRSSSRLGLERLVLLLSHQVHDLQHMLDVQAQKTAPLPVRGKVLGTPTELARWKKLPAFSQLEESLRVAWADSVNVFESTWQWGKDPCRASEQNERLSSLSQFLADCEDHLTTDEEGAGLDPFSEGDAGKATIPGHSGSKCFFDEMKQWWKDAAFDFESAFASHMWLSPPNAAAEGRHTFQHTVVDLVSDFALGRAAEKYTESLHAELSDEQKREIREVVARQVHARVHAAPAFKNKVTDSVKSFDAGFDQEFQGLLAELAAKSGFEEKRAALIKETSDQALCAGPTLKLFCDKIRKRLVTRVKALIPPSSRVAAKTRKQKSRAKAAKNARTRGQGKTSRVSEAHAEENDMFLGMMGFETGWSLVASGPGSRVNVLQRVCSRVIEVINPEGLVSKAAAYREHLEEVLRSIKELLKELRLQQSRWHGGSSPTDEDLAATGLKMARKFITFRSQERMHKESGGLLPPRFDTTPREDPSPAAGPARLHGHIPLDLRDLLAKFNGDDSTARWDSEKQDALVLRALSEYNLRTDEVDTNQPSDHLLTLYGQIVGLEDNNVMRRMVIMGATSEEVHQPHSLRQQEIAQRFGTVQEYVLRLEAGEADLLALTYLVDKTERPLNLYTAWEKCPLRIMPSSSTLTETNTPADALLYFGWKERESSDGTDGEDSSGARTHIFARCVPSAKRRSAASAAASVATRTMTLEPSAPVVPDAYAADLELEDSLQDTAALRAKLHAHGRVVEDVCGNGHCQFAAIAMQIQRFTGEAISYPEVRRSVADWLRRNQRLNVADPSEDPVILETFLEQLDGRDWGDFCNRVEDGAKSDNPLWGNHLTLVAAARCYGREIKVWKSKSDPELIPSGKLSDHATLDQPFEVGQILEQHFVSVRAVDEGAQAGSTHDVGAGSDPKDDTDAGSDPMHDGSGTPPDSGGEVSDENESGSTRQPGNECQVTYANFHPEQWTRSDDAGGVSKFKWYDKAGARDWVLSAQEFAVLSASYPVFAERYVNLRSKPGKDYSRIKGFQLLNCDDAINESETSVFVFDGTGDGKHLSGVLAKCLVEGCRNDSMAPLNADVARNPDYNHSHTLLRHTHKQSVRRFDNIKASIPTEHHSTMDHQTRTVKPLRASTTVVVLTLLKQEGKAKLHSYVLGDSRWALLRKSEPSGGYQVIQVSPALYCEAPVHGAYKGRHDIPLQLSCDSRTLNQRAAIQSIDVQDGDFVVAATDGFFDNFYDVRQGGAHERMPEQDLKAKLLAVFQASSHGQEEAKWAEEFGKALKNTAHRLMASPTGKSDDMAVFVGRVSLGTPLGQEKAQAEKSGDLNDPDGLTWIRKCGFGAQS